MSDRIELIKHNMEHKWSYSGTTTHASATAGISKKDFDYLIAEISHLTAVLKRIANLDTDIAYKGKDIAIQAIKEKIV